MSEEEIFYHFAMNLDLKKGDVKDTAIHSGGSNYFGQKWNLAEKDNLIKSTEAMVLDMLKNSGLPDAITKLVEPMLLSAYKHNASMTAQLELLKEFIFEQHRAILNVNLPSRITCIYLFESDAEAFEAVKRWGWTGIERNFLTLKSINSVTHKADSNWLDCNTKTPDEIYKNYASKYWSGEKSSNFTEFEVLATGQFEIVESKVLKI